MDQHLLHLLHLLRKPLVLHFKSHAEALLADSATAQLHGSQENSTCKGGKQAAFVHLQQITAANGKSCYL